MNEILAQLSQLSGLAEGFIWQMALVFLRVGAAVSLLPALGEQAVPQRVKLALALALTAVTAPAAAMPAGAAQGLLAPMAIEVVVGLILGMGLRLLVLGLQTAGTLAAQSTSLSQMFAGTGPEPAPIISNLLVLAGLALFVATGGLARSAELLIMSYQIMPVGQLPGAAEVADWGLGRITSVFALAFSLALPFVLASVLYNLALGAINRAMPQLMVSMVGAPALTLGGLGLLFLVSPIILAAWRAAVDAALISPFGG